MIPVTHTLKCLVRELPSSARVIDDSTSALLLQDVVQGQTASPADDRPTAFMFCRGGRRKYSVQPPSALYEVQ